MESQIKQVAVNAQRDELIDAVVASLGTSYQALRQFKAAQ